MTETQCCSRYLNAEVINYGDFKEGIVIEFPLGDHERVVVNSYYTNQFGEKESNRIGEFWVFGNIKKKIMGVIDKIHGSYDQHIFIDEDIVSFIEEKEVEDRRVSWEEFQNVI